MIGIWNLGLHTFFCKCYAFIVRPQHYTLQSSIIQMQASIQSSGISKHEANAQNTFCKSLSSAALPLFKPQHCIISAFFSCGDGPSASLTFLFMECEGKNDINVCFGEAGNTQTVADPSSQRKERWDFFCICAFDELLLDAQAP